MQSFAELNTLARVEGRVSNKNGVGFITLFSCLSLLSVIWDYQMLDYNIFHGYCEGKAISKKEHIKK